MPGDELVAAGMARQIERFRVALAAGMPRVGWKVGASDPRAQERMGLSGPLVGWLDGQRVSAPGQAYGPPAGGKPALEAEIDVADPNTTIPESPGRVTTLRRSSAAAPF